MSTLWSLREALEDRAETVRLTPDAVDVAVRRGQAMRRHRRVVAGGVLAVAAAVIVPVLLDARPSNPPVSPTQSATAPTSSPDSTTPGTPTAPPADPFAGLDTGAPLSMPYAIDDLLVDGEIEIRMPGPIYALARVGDEWAVVWVTSDPDVQQLDWVAADGSRREIDRGWFLGLATGDEESDVALAWGVQPSLQGGQGALKVITHSGLVVPDRLQPAEGLPAQVLGVAGRSVVFSFAGDPEGPPLAYNLDTAVTGPLVASVHEAGRSLVALIDDGRVAVVYDAYGEYSGDRPPCLTAYDLSDDDVLWEQCNGEVGSMSPQGTWMLTNTELRDPQTGEIHHDLGLDAFEYVTLAAWEDDDHVLVTGSIAYAAKPDAAPILRCTVSTDACELVPLSADLDADSRIVLGTGSR